MYTFTATVLIGIGLALLGYRRRRSRQRLRSELDAWRLASNRLQLTKNKRSIGA